jgi:hypothetical protein
MDGPTDVQAVCWALRRLGGRATVSGVRARIAYRFGSLHALAGNGSALDDLLFRENGRLWLRTGPGTYELAESGER